MDTRLKAFGRLLDIMDDLREQCPWDMKQTNQSLRLLTIEEMYELVDAILVEDNVGIKEELGDIMLHIVFYTKIAEEQGHFDMTGVLNDICDKLIRRHPHIYGDTIVQSEEDVSNNWEKLKLKEGKKSKLEGVPKSLPAIVKAYRLQDKAKQVGFEWENKEQVWAKVDEEIMELQDNIRNNTPQVDIEDEFGDVLFALVNYARFIKVDPEAALERTNLKFKQRFEYIEKHAHKPLEDMTLGEMDALWNEAKRV